MRHLSNVIAGFAGGERHTPRWSGRAELILGIGADLCDIRRVERVMERFGERFLLRVFTEAERARAARRHKRLWPGTFAKRFAAKEACAKALGTGFSRGVSSTRIWAW